MNIEFTRRRPEDCETLVTFVAPDLPAQHGRAQDLGAVATRAQAISGFKAAAGEFCEVLAPADLPVARLLLVGTGPLQAVDSLACEQLGGMVTARLLQGGVRAVALDATVFEQSAQAAAHLAFGMRLRSYRFDRYWTEQRNAPGAMPEHVHIITRDARATVRRFERLEAQVAGIVLARDLVAEPGNVLTPVAFAQRIRELATDGVRVEVLGQKKLASLGFGALLGVAQGSVCEPQVVICEYDGTRGRRRRAPVVLAGKGVTFDAGGISIKPSAGLETLKQDMGGAAAIVGVMRTLALRKARCHVVGICGLVENMPSGSAQRPGDVVRSHSGKTIEVINTDAEGRLVLADLLSYAQEHYRPRVVVDMATLTGAIVIALGHEYAGLFCNDEVLASQLLAAGERSGDRLWRYPMGEAYDRHLRSLIADMKNLGPNEGRSIIAAQFIQRFVQPGVAWAHVDFGGRTWTDEDTALSPQGATGFGVRLLDDWLAAHHE